MLVKFDVREVSFKTVVIEVGDNNGEVLRKQVFFTNDGNMIEEISSVTLEKLVEICRVADKA